MAATRLSSRVHEGIAAVDARAWNELALGGVPFLRHEFLAALEATGAACPATGWTPRHVTVHAGGELVGALPLYEKTHSYGEFVFDFSWAQAYRQHGLAYYPKLVAATPFTPATGPRLLVRPGVDPVPVRRALVAAALAAGAGTSSLHVEFATAPEVALLAEFGFLPRLDCQYHWRNQGFADFEAFLGTFTAEKRKKARRERRRVAEAGIGFRVADGADLSADEWRRVWALHAGTFRRRGNEPYLPLETFLALSRHAATTPRVLLALKADRIIATAIFFAGESTLYGRYWGADDDYHSLHFEACYHQGIEYAIARGLTTFEPGTQGEHKIARGFGPVLTHSAHFIAEPRFREAIGRFLDEERAAVQAYAADVHRHVPFRASERTPELP